MVTGMPLFVMSSVGFLRVRASATGWRCCESGSAIFRLSDTALARARLASDVDDLAYDSAAATNLKGRTLRQRLSVVPSNDKSRIQVVT